MVFIIILTIIHDIILESSTNKSKGLSKEMQQNMFSK